MEERNLTYILACGGLRAELEEVRKEGQIPVQVIYLPQNLHRKPEQMPEIIQNKIEQIKVNASKIVLGYGLCSNGVVGVKAPSQGLYIPKTHDCISLYLGSLKRYYKVFHQNPGTYYLTKSWIDANVDPLGLMENEYKNRVGEEDAKWTLDQELKNYTHICFINTNITDTKKYRERAKKNAEVFNKKYIELESSYDYLRKILYGPYDRSEFLYIKPLTVVKQSDFLNN